MTECSLSISQDELVATTDAPRSTDDRPYGDRAHVLSQTDDRSALQTVPTAVCCPNCGKAVTLYKRGLPEVVPYFDTACG